MQCSQCGFENPDGMRFCGQCGSTLPRRCPTCSAANPASFKFCGVCGSPLTAGVPSATICPPATPETPAVAEPISFAEPALPSGGTWQAAERRQITVMFCDLVGSTALSAALDPEEFRELLRSYQQAAAAAIEKFEGYVAQYLGDGILAYFGYPVAYENEAGRAVHAALEILDRIRELNAARSPAVQYELAVRVGIHSGVVVIGEVGGGSRREQLALGEVPNVAARLQAMAAPNSVVLSATTYRLVDREFLSEDLGARIINGLPRAEHAFRVLQERPESSLSPAQDGTAEPAIVGRQRELTLLLDRWREAKAGRCQVVVISGDAGIGKSRLVRAFVERLQGESFLLLEGRCLPYYQNTAFYPIIDLLHRRMNYDPNQSAKERLESLVEMLKRDGSLPPDSVPVFTSLLSLPVGDEARRSSRSAAGQREATHAALLALFARSAQRQPVVLLLEDLHWADPSTLDLFDRLIPESAGLSAMVILTHRPEFRLPWGALPNLSRFTLPRLERFEVEAIVERVADHRRLPMPVMEQIVQRTDGVPLFVEELTKMILETGLLQVHKDRYELEGPLPPLAIPTTLHDSLEARLDHLATTKELAQLGAALGREFSYSLISAVSKLDETLLRRSLAQLVDAELLQQRGVPPQAVYSFRHALIQEAAYQSLLKSSRQQHHLRIAQVVEGRFLDLVATEPERLAQHYTGAGLPERALGYWLQAGSRALERSANQEAVAHLAQARAVLDSLPETDPRARQELTLQLILGPALVATRGYTAPEVRDAYLRAASLAERAGDPGASFHAGSGLFSSYLVHSELDEATRQAESLLELARQSGDSARLLAGSVALGAALVEKGHVNRGRKLLEEGLQLYDSSVHFPLTFQIGQDFGVVGLGYLGHALWLLGFAEQGVQRTHEALALARRLEHPHTLAFALAFNATARYQRREPQPLLALTEELRSLAERECFRHWVLHATALGGWARVELGDVDTGLAILRRIQELEPRGGVRPAYYLRLLAWALNRVGSPEEALRVLEGAVDELAGSGTSTWRMAELERLRGMLLARLRGREQEAEEALRRSLQLATDLETRSLQLRAATSLVQLLGKTQRGDEARRILRDVYGAFQEGFDLPDLREARQLLEEGAAAPAAVS
jgi:class 3 adenylate cyclase